MQRAVTAVFSVLIIVLLLITLVMTNRRAFETLRQNQPDWYFLNLNSYKKFDQVLAVSFGYRAFLSDIYYISFLQYYGDRRNLKNRFRDLPRYLNDITDADPGFEFAYQYGAAILGFNMKRYDDAMQLINKGIEFNPKMWRLREYAGAIAYQQQGNEEKYIQFLESALRYSDRPAIIERILGNIYEKTKTPDEAAAYWVLMLAESKHTDTTDHAAARLKAIIESGKLENPEKFLKRIEQ